MEPAIQNATNEIPLQRNESCSRKEDIHSRCDLRLQARYQMFHSTIYDNEMIAHDGSVISSLPGSDTRLQEITEAQEEHPVCSQRSKFTAMRDDLTSTH